MNEAETRAELIDPALTAAGWGIVDASRVRREQFTQGRLLGAGQRGEPEIADYVLTYREQRMAVIEAKKRSAGDTAGLAQAKAYAGKLNVRFAYSTNGVRIYRVDMVTSVEGYVDNYPTPDELWNETFAESNAWRDRFAAVPYESGSKKPYYYQDIAINHTLEAIAHGKVRILLTLATGTGKTFIAFQIAWKLFHSRWNLSGEPTRRPRVLFLADRNNLADQAFNAFSAFADDALVRIDPKDIRKKGRVPKNGSIFFTIFQTFMSGLDDAPYFGEYPPDFFDFIVIDECHRGGAKDESTWREILTYFAPAVQLGLTATPKRKGNVDTYAYFGEPVYVYSLKEGINDGFLTPFKVKQIATTIDDYLYTPDDAVVEGEVVAGKRYTESDFNRNIIIDEREEYRVKLLMDWIHPKEKTLVFCASQDHASTIRDLINQMKRVPDVDYCVRVTADEGARGDQKLREFQDNEKIIPTVLTTSHKLSTGVDARNVRNVVLMRPVNSMIEFKQIIGRGTRLFDGKDYFTIYDFVKAHHHFSDPEWDGEPVDNTTEGGTTIDGSGDLAPVVKDPPGDDPQRPKRIKIKLADGKSREFQNMSATCYLGADGMPMSAAQFIESLYGALPDFFKDEEELRRVWSVPDTRQKLLAGLAEKGFGTQQLAEMQRIIEAENSDLFDVLSHVAFARAPVPRLERAASARDALPAHFNDKQQAFLNFVLNQYVEQGVDELNEQKLGPLLELKYHGINDAIQILGKTNTIRGVFVDFQKYLYQGS